MNFDWPICDDEYRIVQHEFIPFKPEPRPTGIALLRWQQSETMFGAISRELDASPHIVAKSKKERLHRPLEFHKTLYVEFAKLDGSPESCLKFAGRFGLLGLEPKRKGEALVYWQEAITNMGNLIKAAQTDRRALEGLRIGPLHGVLTPSPPDGRLVFRFRPSSLLHGMHLQFVQAISSGLDIKQCGHCGKLFEAGGDERRRDARFCSKECKINFHNLEKRRVK